MAATSTTKVLTAAREAVWKALRGWPHWALKIQTHCDTDAAVKAFLQSEPNISRLPMLSAQWNQTNPAWWVHSQQNWKCPLEIAIWVPEDRMSLAEALVEDVVDAVFRAEHSSSTSTGPMSIVRQEVGENPQILAMDIGLPVQVGDEGKHRLLRSAVVFQLALKKSPVLRPGA